MRTREQIIDFLDEIETMMEEAYKKEFDKYHKIYDEYNRLDVVGLAPYNPVKNLINIGVLKRFFSYKGNTEFFNLMGLE